MEDIKNWLEQYRRAVEAAFGERICFLGLQGSRARGEAGPDSDIDVVLVLDRLAPEDLARYRQAVAALPDRALLCGFLSGREELLHWSKGELFQFYHDTTALIGSLEDLRPLAESSAAAGEAVLNGACALYHACIHNALHGRSEEMLKELFKTAAFTLRAKHFLETGTYIPTRAELLPVLHGMDLAVLEAGETLRQGGEVDLDALSALLLEWSGALLRRSCR